MRRTKIRLRRLVSLVFVAVCRDCIACACQSNLISTLGHYTVASLYTSQDLNAFAVVGSYRYFLFFITLFVQLQIYEEDALFLCQRGARKRNHVFHC